MGRREFFTVGELTMVGISQTVGTHTVTVLARNEFEKVLFCTGTDVPHNGDNGFAKGCLFIKTDAVTGTKGLYENQGTSSACAFNVIGDITVAEISLAEGNVLVGNNAGVGVALSAKGDAKILIGNGTTITSVTISGDITIDNAGAVTIGAKKVTTSKIAAAAGTVLVGTKTSGDVTALSIAAEGAMAMGQGAGETPAANVLSGDATMDKAGVVSLPSTLKTGAYVSIDGDDKTYTAADLLGTNKIIIRGALTGDSIDVLPAGADMVAAWAGVSNLKVGDKVEFYVWNQSPTYAISLGVGGSGGFVWDGGCYIAPNQCCKFIGWFSNIGAGTEALVGMWSDAFNYVAFGNKESVLSTKPYPNSGYMPVLSLPKRVVPDITTPVADATANAITVTAAMMLSGLLLRDCTGGDRNDTFDTAANLVAAINAAGGAARAGHVIEFVVYNNSTGVELWQRTLPAGMTSIPGAVYSIAPGQSCKFFIRLTDVGSGTEAADVYHVPMPLVAGKQLAAAAVSLAHLDSGLAPAGASVAVAIEDGYAIADNDNAGALDSGYALANSLKTVMNAHAAHAAGVHATADEISFPVATDDADTLAKLLTLSGALLTAFDTHDADAEIAGPGPWAFHIATEAGDHSLVSAVTPTTLAEALTRLNDLKEKYNAHDADTTCHTASLHQEGTADVVRTAVTRVACANALPGDTVMWHILDDGAGDETGVSAAAITAGVEFTFASDPADDVIISYGVFRALA